MSYWCNLFGLFQTLSLRMTKSETMSLI